VRSIGYGNFLNVKPKSECVYDCISLGEIMLRLDPERVVFEIPVLSGMGRRRRIQCYRGLKKCFGMDVAVVTAFADNDVGRLLEELHYAGGR
jgi:2-dehydro-3-deoxygluconokinase